MNTMTGRLRFTAGFEPEILGQTRLGSLLALNQTQPHLFDYTSTSILETGKSSTRYVDWDDDAFEDDHDI